MIKKYKIINWEIYGNIIDDLTQISEDLNWTRMDRYGRGVSGRGDSGTIMT